ncbi:MAG TPA: histidine phosphatase family protein [Blastocatellia bacterium]|nr:histidine phosphatase family protein [Blastocatellia bacterium]
MKTLLLLRHAKSSWDDVALRDFERPLADRGKRDAPRMGEELKLRTPLPDLIISSPATRARQTAQAVVDSGGLTARMEFNDSIYGATSAELMRLIRRLPDAVNCALMVGHNPGFEELVSRLTGSDERMPTAALASIEFQIDHWNDLEDGAGRLIWLLTPKKLKGEERDSTEV